MLQTYLDFHIKFHFNTHNVGYECYEKCRQYSQEYLKYGLERSCNNEAISMCLLCENTLSNDTMKLAKTREHLERIHSDKNRMSNITKCLGRN